MLVQKNGKGVLATVTKAQATLVDYDVLFPDGNMERWTPAHLLRDLRVSLFPRETGWNECMSGGGGGGGGGDYGDGGA